MSGCTTYGSTPTSNSPSAIVNAIAAIYTNRYNAGVTAGNNTGYNAGTNEGYLRGYNDGKAEASTVLTTQAITRNKSNVVPLTTKYLIFAIAHQYESTDTMSVNAWVIDFTEHNIWRNNAIITDNGRGYSSIVTETSSEYTIGKAFFQLIIIVVVQIQEHQIM